MQTLFLAHQLMHFDITSIEKCQTRPRISVFLPWRPTLHTKAHTKSNFSPTPNNVERAAEFKLSLKSKRESEKRRELDKRHLMHVIILRNTINIQANRSVQTVVNREAGKPW